MTQHFTRPQSFSAFGHNVTVNKDGSLMIDGQYLPREIAVILNAVYHTTGNSQGFDALEDEIGTAYDQLIIGPGETVSYRNYNG